MNSSLDMNRSGEEVVRDHLWWQQVVEGLIRWSTCGR